VLQATRCKCRTQKSRKKSPSGHHRTTLSGYIFATKARIYIYANSLAKLQCVYYLLVVMATLRSRCGHYIFALWFLSIFLSAGPRKVAKNCHLGTIAQLCRVISLQLRHVSTIGKKLVKQQYLLHMFSQYRELRPTSG